MIYPGIIISILLVFGLILLAGAYLLLAEIVAQSIATVLFDDEEIREQLATAIDLFLVGIGSVGLYLYFA